MCCKCCCKCCSKCRPVAFVLGLALAFFSTFLVLVGAATWIIGIGPYWCFPQYKFFAAIIGEAVKMMKSPVAAMRKSIESIPC
ncbi:hypothetical protein OROGR_012630 [Orobanche gracilis]